MIDYIENLILNYKIPETPIKLDIVIEGGALNGYYALGCLKLIKGLEKKGYFKVERFSGASVGSLLGSLYLLNKLEIFTDLYEELKKNYVLDCNFKYVKDTIIKIIDNLKDEEFEIVKENKLYITYFDMDNKNQIVKKNYSTRDELKNTILSSIHIPYLIDGNEYHNIENNYFLDGLYPYLFKERESNKKILYISIINPFDFNSIKDMIFTKNEKNMSRRIISGVLDCHNFILLNKKTKLCSYLDEWGPYDRMTYRMKQFYFVYLVVIYLAIKWLIKKIRPKLLEYNIYYKLECLFIEICKDILICNNS